MRPECFPYRARELDIPTPILNATCYRPQIDRAYQIVLATDHRQIGMLSMAFKTGSDDLRESPVVSLAEILLGKGCEFAVYDGEVSRANLIGANREYIAKEIPHILVAHARQPGRCAAGE
jgi:GDP-mannose 6-dehydrogenase